MTARRPTKAERNRVVTLDLLADWRRFAPPLPDPRSEHDWRYYGTITVNEQTGAMAWRAGGYGFGCGAGVRELGVWDRIKINAILQFGNPPGLDGVPVFAPARMATTP
ncbi:MAG: hypothetical protein ACREPL_03745 [Rhodanobacteraceae bacterium]